MTRLVEPRLGAIPDECRLRSYQNHSSNHPKEGWRRRQHHFQGRGESITTKKEQENSITTPKGEEKAAPPEERKQLHTKEGWDSLDRKSTAIKLNIGFARWLSERQTGLSMRAVGKTCTACDACMFTSKRIAKFFPVTVHRIMMATKN